MSHTSGICQRIASLRGKRIVRATVIEMALVESTGGLPIFRHAAAPFVQAIRIELALHDGSFVLFFNEQNDGGDFPMGMDILDRPEIVEAQWTGAIQDGKPSIYRIAPPPNFPLGEVTSAKTQLGESGDLLEVNLTVAGHEVTLRAGEVIEDSNTLAACDMAGSILVFLDAKARRSAKLNQPIRWA